MTDPVSFDRAAERYDETRRVPIHWRAYHLLGMGSDQSVSLLRIQA